MRLWEGSEQKGHSYTDQIKQHCRVGVREQKLSYQGLEGSETWNTEGE